MILVLSFIANKRWCIRRYGYGDARWPCARSPGVLDLGRNLDQHRESSARKMCMSFVYKRRDLCLYEKGPNMIKRFNEIHIPNKMNSVR